MNSSLRGLIVSVLVVVILAACSADLSAPASAGGDATATTDAQEQSEPSVEPTATTIELVKQPTVKFSGKSNKNTASFSLGSPLRVDYSHSGSANFIVQLVGTDVTQFAGIANVIGKAKTSTWVYGGSGKAHFEIIGSGSWTITGTTVSPKIAKLPTTFKSNVGLTTSPFAADGDITIKWSHKGDANFIVTLIDPTDGSLVDGVANVIGSDSDETVLYDQHGLRAFDVVADGSWTLTVEPS